MGAFPAAVFTSREESKQRDKERKHEASLIELERIQEEEDKKKQAAKGRTALIQTTPQGSLNPQNSGRKRLTA